MCEEKKKPTTFQRKNCAPLGFLFPHRHGRPSQKAGSRLRQKLFRGGTRGKNCKKVLQVPHFRCVKKKKKNNEEKRAYNCVFRLRFVGAKNRCPKIPTRVEKGKLFHFRLNPWPGKRCWAHSFPPAWFCSGVTGPTRRDGKKRIWVNRVGLKLPPSATGAKLVSGKPAIFFLRSSFGLGQNFFRPATFFFFGKKTNLVSCEKIFSGLAPAIVRTTVKRARHLILNSKKKIPAPKPSASGVLEMGFRHGSLVGEGPRVKMGIGFRGLVKFVQFPGGRGAPLIQNRLKFGAGPLENRKKPEAVFVFSGREKYPRFFQNPPEQKKECTDWPLVCFLGPVRENG